jgi:hypothetical protein
MLELHELSRSAAGTVLERFVHPPLKLAPPSRPLPGGTSARESTTFLGNPVGDHLSVAAADRLVETDPRS